MRISLAILAALIATACSSPTTPLPTPTVLHGRGPGQTAPVTLDGDYSIAWQITSNPRIPCSITGLLKSTEATVKPEVVVSAISMAVGESRTGEVYTYKRPAGQYYVEWTTITDCEWSLTFTRA